MPELGQHKNASGDIRWVTQIDADGVVWWKTLGEDGEHWDTPKQWQKWMDGE
jgi:hypothetical protein